MIEIERDRRLRVDLGLVLDQQTHNRLVAVLGSPDEGRPPVLPENTRVYPSDIRSTCCVGSLNKWRT